MKINWKVRFKNPIWWIGLMGVIFTAMGVSPEMFTNWGIVCENIISLFQNPFMVASVVVAVIGYNTDHTTFGLSDSVKAMDYMQPFKEGE